MRRVAGGQAGSSATDRPSALSAAGRWWRVTWLHTVALIEEPVRQPGQRQGATRIVRPEVLRNLLRELQVLSCQGQVADTAVVAVVDVEVAWKSRWRHSMSILSNIRSNTRGLRPIQRSADDG